MSHGPDFILDIDGLRRPASGEAGGRGKALRGRPWLSVRWRCCSVYSRIYRNPEQTAYMGRCPRCGRMVRAQVGPNGTSARFFEAG